MAISINVSGYADYAVLDDSDSYVVIGGTLPMLLSGKGNPLDAIDVAGSILIDHLMRGGLDKATAYLDRRRATVNIVHVPERKFERRRVSVVTRHDFALAGK